MIVLLKMHAWGKIFEKMYQKIYPFFLYVLWSGDRGTQFFGGGDIQQKKKVKTFLACRETPKSPPLVGHSLRDSPHKENPEEDLFFKSKRENLSN